MSTRFKILHADDDRIARLLLAHHASKEPDCDVVSVPSGLEAWHMLREGLSPDLCILDILMPGLSGLALLRQMRSDPQFSKMPVILCTATRERESVEVAAGLGVSYYLLKPYREALVREQILRVRQAQNTVAGADESAATICARLRLDAVIGQELLTRFAQEINATLEAGERSLVTLDADTFDAVLTHLSSLKGVAKILCISSVLLEVSRLENSLTFFTESPLSQAEEGKELVNLSKWRQEAWRREYCTAVLPGLARLKRLADRWIAPPQATIAAIAEATSTAYLNPAGGLELRVNS